MSYKRNRIDGYNKSIIKYDTNRAQLNNEINSVSDQNYKDLLDRYGLVTQQLVQIQQQLISINTALGLSGNSVNFNNQASLNLGNRFKVNCSTTGQTLNFGNTSDVNDVTDNQLVFAPGNTVPNSANGVAKLTKDGVVLNDKTLFFRSSGAATFQASAADPNHTIKYGSSNDGLELNSFNTTMIKRNGVNKFAINENNVVSSVDILSDFRLGSGTGGIRVDHKNDPSNNTGEKKSIDFGQDYGLLSYQLTPDINNVNRKMMTLAGYEGVSLGFRDSALNSYGFQQLLQADRWGVKAYRQFKAPNTFQTGLHSADRTFEDSEVVVTFPEAMASVPAVFLSFDHTGTLTAGGHNPPGDDNGPDPYYMFTHHNIWDISTTGFKCQYGCIKYNFGATTSSEYRRLAIGTDPNAHKSAIELKFDTSKTINFRWFAICG